MAKASGPIVGLDIGSAFIKVVELSNKGGKPEIEAIGIMPTPPDAVIQGLIIDPPAMGGVIQHLLEISGIKSRRVVSSIAGVNNVTVRLVEVPTMSDKELADTMKLEIDRFVPFAHGQQIERAYQKLPIPATTEGNEQVILAVAVQDVINSHLQALQAAGLDIVAVEPEPLALARGLTCMTEDLQPLNETIGIVMMGASVTDLSVVTGGMLIFPRSISIGGESFTKALAENLGLRVDAAERLKRQFAAVDMNRVSQESDPFANDVGELGDGPPMFDFNVPPPGAGGPSATPGLNPFMYGGAGAAAGDSPFGVGVDSVGAAPVSEEESASQPANVFDLGPSEGGEMEELFSTQISRPSAPRVVSNMASGVDLGGFDLGPEFDEGEGESDEERQTAMQVQEMIAPVLGELVTELRRSIEYYRSHNQGLPISKLVLCGGCARMENIDRFLEAELGIAVSKANPMSFVSVSAPFASAEWLADVEPSFAVAIGLAEREWVTPPKNYIPATVASPVAVT